nr:MAG TPA: hypothetical protein [Caudoviricetes sp.]
MPSYTVTVNQFVSPPLTRGTLEITSLYLD